MNKMCFMMISISRMEYKLSFFSNYDVILIYHLIFSATNKREKNKKIYDHANKCKNIMFRYFSSFYDININ